MSSPSPPDRTIRWRSPARPGSVWIATVVLVAMVVVLLPGARAAAAQAVPSDIVVTAPEHLRGLEDHLRLQFSRVRDDVRDALGSEYAGTVRLYIVDGAEGVGAVIAALREGQAGPRAVTVPEGFVGWAVPSQGVIVLNVYELGKNGLMRSAIQTFRHEYAHLVLGQFQQTRRWPAWFEEGVAQWVEQSIHTSGQTLLEIRAGTVEASSFAEISELIHARTRKVSVQRGYALAENAVRVLMVRNASQDRYPLATLGTEFAAGASFEAAFERAFRETVPAFEARWLATFERNAIGRAFDWASLYGVDLLFGFCALLVFVALYRRRRARIRWYRQLDAELP